MEEIRTLEDLTNHAGFATRALYFVSSNIKWLDLDWFISKRWKTVNISLYYFPFKSSLNIAKMFLTIMERKFSDWQLVFSWHCFRTIPMVWHHCYKLSSDIWKWLDVWTRQQFRSNWVSFIPHIEHWSNT